MYKYSDSFIDFHHSYDRTPKEEDFKLSAHEKNEIYYFITGKGSYFVEGTVYKLQPGCLMIMRAGEFHKLLIEPDLPYERMAVHFSSDLLRDVDPQGELLSAFIKRPLGSGNLFLPTEIGTGHIYECLKSIDSAGKDKYSRRLAVICNLYSILYEIKVASELRSSSRTKEPKNDIINEIIAYINANLSGELSLEDICGRFFISKNHINRLFKSSTGTTVWDYIRIKRLYLAKELMAGGLTASAACQNSGFKDYSSFYRAYVSRFGVSPKKD